MKQAIIRKISIPMILLFLFMVGFGSGVLFAFLNSQALLTDSQVLTPDFFHKLENISVDKPALFVLVLIKQLRTFFLLQLLAATIMKRLVLFSYTVLQGAFIGGTMELLMILYGITGMGLYALLVLPHGIFYFLAYSILLVQKLKEAEAEEGYIFLQKKKERKQKLFMALVLLVIGSIAEAYWNFFVLFH